MTIRVAPGTVATVVLSRPEKLNALTPEMLVALGDALEALAADDATRVIVLTGEGRAFSAGVDLEALGGIPIVDGCVGDVLDVPARRVTALLANVPKITIAKVNGHCFTGALELALACDLIVAAEEAVFGDTHVRFGLRPTWGMSQRFVRMVGVARARELSYTARTFSGTDAAAWGLAARAVPRAELDASVTTLADAIAANSPDALAAYKDLYRAAADQGLADGLRYEATTTYSITDSDERIAAFAPARARTSEGGAGRPGI
jgi:enoyl-CoA hydratase/carnithine racemase